MESQLARQFNDSIKALQCLVGESVTINQITYPCIVGVEHLEQKLTEGGFEAVSNVGVSISLTDILASPLAPAIGNTVLLIERERTYRIESITPTQTTWELSLEDVTA